MLIDTPNYPEKFDFVDADCKAIVEYLYNTVNYTFSNTKQKLIKTYRAWNDIEIPTVDYPVLKVYAESETVFENAPFLSTSFTIAYGLAYTTKPKVGDVSRFVTKELIRALINAPLEEFMFQIDWRNQFNVQYETLISPGNVIYRYSTINCNIFTRMDLPE
jgi:hypothetical protein